MLKATEYEILRNVKADGRIKIALARQPVRVATIMDEAAFSRDQLMIHNRTVFLEDRVHDWDWRDGQFRYYTRVSECADVLVVYAVEDVVPPDRFDGVTGKPLAASPKGTAPAQRLTEAQKRVLRWIGHGWSTEPGAGSAVLVNGKRICNTDTMMALYRAGLASRDDRGCWSATASGETIAAQLESETVSARS